MVNKKIGIVILFVLLIMPVVLAKETTINIKTLAEHEVILKTLDPYPSEGESNIIEYFEETSDEDGEVSFTSYSSKGQIDILVIVEKDGNRIKINDEFLHKFEKKATGGIINLDVKEKPVVIEPEPKPIVEPEPVVEEVVEEPEPEVVVEEIEEQPESGKLTGLFIDKGKAVVTSKTTYYIIGGIFLLSFFFFMILMVRKKLKAKKGTYLDFKVKPYREFKEEDYDDKILSAEKKIKEAEKELEEITSKRKQLREVKEKFERDKAELESLEKD